MCAIKNNGLAMRLTSETMTEANLFGNIWRFRRYKLQITKTYVNQFSQNVPSTGGFLVKNSHTKYLALHGCNQKHVRNGYKVTGALVSCKRQR